jgi:hypothetical protein
MDVVVVIDVGSPKAGKLGWAYQNGDAPIETGKDLDAIADRIGVALKDSSVALGFEAPLFVPFRSDVMSITGARVGEGNRPWSAGAGTAVTSTALVVVPYTLARIRKQAPNAHATMDWRDFRPQPGTLFLFEAFVSGAAKGNSHCDDATIALQAFQERSQRGIFESAINEADVLNLMGAALLRTGWTTAPDVLSQDCLVIRPLPGTME